MYSRSTRPWLSGAALIAVPATAVDVSKEKTPINDTWLTAKTKIALAADGRVKGRQIDVETTKGVVMLRGKVDSDAAKQAAEDITKMLDGVKTCEERPCGGGSIHTRSGGGQG